jgi:hypothetical protein
METAKKRTPKTLPPAPLRIHSLALTEEDSGALSALAHACSDRIGRAISHSAVLRALIRLTDRGTVPLPTLVEGVEEELQSGRKWGRLARKT